MVYIMNKCWNCGVEFIDPTNVCPLCKCITEREDAEEEEFKPTYPFRPDKEIKKIQLRDEKNPAGAEHLYAGGHYC